MRPRLHHIIFLLLLSVMAGCATDRGLQDANSNPRSYHYQMGLSFLGELNYTSALVELTEAEKLDPDNPDVLYNLGIAYMGKRRPDLAEPRFLKAIMLKPENSSARNDLGVAYLDLKRWDNAIQQFRIVKDDLFYANSDNAAINLALAYLGKGDYPKAQEELNAVLRDNPRKLEARLSLGRVFFAMDRPEQAIAEYKRVLDVYHDYGDAHYYLGLAYLKIQDIAAARTAFREVIRIKPNSELGRSSASYLELLK
ncbi:MAG: tetratricopeptide repeat protein [Desulfuromonadales bacterium]|nr:tetratricopeptide repeat protein [Desulfuromonadales bacterium]